MERIVRTVYGSYLQTVKHLGLPFVMTPKTTLNEKFDIQSGVAPTVNQYPDVGYYAIGNGGHKYITGAGGIALTEPLQHKATDAALFKHLPFVLRKPELDLSPAQRANYALRRQETYNGQTYIAYYLRRIVKDGVNVNMEYRIVRNGTTVVNPFVPDNSNLNPTPPELTPNGVNTTDGDYVASSAKMALILTVDDIAEILNAAKIMFGDEAYAIISEIALCSGINKTVSVPGVGGRFNFNEAIAVQVATHFSTHNALKFNSTGLRIALDSGSTEPLYALSQL